MWHFMGLFLAFMNALITVVCLVIIASALLDKRRDEDGNRLPVQKDAIGFSVAIGVVPFIWALTYFLSYWL